MLRITIYRPDGATSYDNVEVDSFTDGIVNFSVQSSNDPHKRQMFRTNMPFIIEHEE